MFEHILKAMALPKPQTVAYKELCTRLNFIFFIKKFLVNPLFN